jgi:membrane-bound lytic murein transglycosylase F
MGSNKWLTTAVLLLPIVTIACLQSPQSAEVLRKADDSSVELSANSEESSLVFTTARHIPSSRKYESVAQKHAAKYGLDWRLVIAVINRESSFRHNVVSRRGAYGLMQIMPGTRAEIERKLGLREAKTPSNNVKAGVYYLTRLSGNFATADDDNRLKLTLAAYNAGLTRVRDAQKIAEHLGDDKNAWEDVRSALPLLSRRFSSLHRQIWEDGKPRGGYFGNPTETIEYVDKVLHAYDQYALSTRHDNSL